MEKIIILVLLVLAFGIAVLLAFLGVVSNSSSRPRPPEHLKPKSKCICNNIANHSPGGKCEACFKKNSMPRYENPPSPPDRGITITKREYSKTK